LAKQIKAKINITSTDTSVTEFNNVLTSIGFIDPVTKEISGKSYFLDLANQIQEFFKSYFLKEEGILSLIDAYCIYNRSRGISILI
jgi:ESCRT-II complex subunit VPS36